ncbi:MAG: YitT family protein [Clostridiales bacterium]|nr:YitT family protein [Clostridiales bacterium]
MRNINYKTMAVDFGADVAGGILIAAGTYNFAANADFPMVGVNGIALIFYHLFGTPIGLVAFLLNIPIAICCFRILGRTFFVHSVRTIVVTSLIMDYVAPLFPVYEGERLLAALCTGVLAGLGFALIYMRGSSTGGVDFIILSIKAKRPHISIGKITFAIDLAVVLLGTILISADIDGLIYGVIVSFLISIMVDKVMYGIDVGKMALIVTDHPKQVSDAIVKIAGRGSTFLRGQGSYTGEEKTVVMCACNNKQMYPIRNAVKEIDAGAFVIIMESNEVIGEGFKPY